MRQYGYSIYVFCLCVLLAHDVCLAQATRPSRRAESPKAPPDPEQVEALRQLGARDTGAHDPSTIIKCKDTYWIYMTGYGVYSIYSKDLITWHRGPRVFEQPPAWIADTVPGNRDGHCWAPDIIKVGDKYMLFYSVSVFGKNTSAIAVATNSTLDPADPDFKWTDGGVVIRSVPKDIFNAIDPAVVQDADGKLWMSFGSYWGGIKMIELNPATGHRIDPDSKVYSLAYAPAIEAPYIYRRGGKYYLFVNHGFCCRGINSTYNTRVGRSDQITGPYLDKEGRDLMQVGGMLLASTEGPLIGPGHAGIFEENGKFWYSSHFYDGTDRGLPKLQIRPLTWGEDGWPVLGRVE